MSDNKKPTLNRAARRSLAAKSRKRSVHRGSAAVKAPADSRQIASDVHVYTDDSYKDRAKVVYSHGLQQAKERIASINARFDLPERINTVRRSFSRWLSRLPSWLQPCLAFFRNDYTTVAVINRDGHPRDFMLDAPGRHVILCHRCIARHLVSECCMLVRIAANTDKEGNNIDGSWAIVPAQYAMMRTTTIQHLRRRPFFFLRRYWYEIDFDGRVQPAHMLFDYNINPTKERTRFYVTHEYVPVRNQDETNDYFRFWRDKPSPCSVNGGTAAVPKTE